ncbi:hypothetical protein B0H13DRAFT_1892847 [Mycena leptocephala]|nr:hypothetical protein B0H13DRAFT_1892847 [Mycena leptocephala]
MQIASSGGRKFCQIFGPSSFLYHHLPNTVAQLPAPKRARMVSQLTLDDQALIDNLPTGIVTAFRSSIYQPAYIAANAHLFINNDWIDVVQLREFLKHTKNPPPRPISPLHASRLSRDTASVLVHNVKTRIVQEGKREVLEILSDSEEGLDSDSEGFATHEGRSAGDEMSVPDTPTAFVIDADDHKFDFKDKHGQADQEQGNTGTGDSKVWVKFELGKPEILCRRSRLECKGSYVCERVDERLLDVTRRDLDPASRDAVFAAQRQTRREEGTTAERKVTEFIKLIRSQKCGATDENGVKCRGVPILKNKLQMSRNHKSGSDAAVTAKTAAANTAVGPFGTTSTSRSLIRRHQCHRPSDYWVETTTLPTIYVPVDPSIRKALIIHPRNVAHNHPMPALKKPSRQSIETYRQCVKANGCVGATVAKVDNSPSTLLLLGGKTPGEFAPALQSKRVKQRILLETKKEEYPAGLDAPGAFKLFWEDMKKPINDRYIHRLVTGEDGGVMILTCLSALMKLLDDEGVTSFETDTTFKRVAGDINEWEVVIFLKALQRVTIARAYVNGASADFFERLYDAFQAVKLQVTGKPLAFKRFVKGGNIIAMNSDMEAAQVLGAARSVFKSNDPEYSGISVDTPGEEVAPEFIKLCTTHAKRGVLDFRSLVSEEDYQRLMDFVYIDSAEKLDEFSEFVRGLGVKKIQGAVPEISSLASIHLYFADWWDHMPSIKSQSPMSTEDRDSPIDDQYGRTGRPDRTQSGILVNSHNEAYHRTALRNDESESHELADERARIELEIEAEKRESAAQLKALQTRKSATRKTKSGGTQRARGAGRAVRTVFVSANPSGRVTTRTIGVSSVLHKWSASTPLREAPPIQPVASTSAPPLPMTDYMQEPHAAAMDGGR